MRRARKVRAVRKTLLLVCEGKAEVRLAELLKMIYTRDGNGHAVTIKNAGGKGARNVINFAIRQQKAIPRDLACAILDTDTDWNDQVQGLARRGRITVVPCDPCVECVLLGVRGEKSFTDSSKNKEHFAKVFGGAVHEDGIVARAFTKADFDAARSRVGAIDVLLRAMGIDPPKKI